jgi:hypothetical protein
MKVELIKEESISKPTHYYTEVDGMYIPGSVKTNEEDAIMAFNGILERVQAGFPTEPRKTVIDSWDSNKQSQVE